MNNAVRRSLIDTVAFVLIREHGQPPIELAKSIVDRIRQTGFLVYSSPHEVRAAVREIDSNAELAGQAPRRHG